MAAAPRCEGGKGSFHSRWGGRKEGRKEGCRTETMTSIPNPCSYSPPIRLPWRPYKNIAGVLCARSQVSIPATHPHVLLRATCISPRQLLLFFNKLLLSTTSPPLFVYTCNFTFRTGRYVFSLFEVDRQNLNSRIGV